MGSMDRNTRVALRHDPTWEGTVTGPARNGMVPVAGDGGWRGTVPEDSLVPIEDKSWPPATLETK